MRELRSSLMSHFIIGLTTLLPTVLFLVFILWLYSLMESALSPIIDLFETMVGVTLPRIPAVLVTILLIGALIIGTGWFIETRFGGFLNKKYNSLVERYNPIYKNIKEWVQLFFESIRNKGLVSRVVMVDTEVAKGGKLFALVAGDCEEAFLAHLENPTPDAEIAMLIMHGPIGNTGFTAVVPLRNVHECPNMTISDFVTKYNLRFGNGLIETLSGRKKVDVPTQMP